MEQYVLDALSANADAVVAGSGPLVVMVISMLAELEQATVFDDLERTAGERCRELTRLSVQHALDAQAAAEQPLPAVTGADGVIRRRAEPGHERKITTTAGDVIVRRIGYRAGVTGVPSLFPRDAVLNLPPGSYSWRLRELAVMFTRDGAYQRAGDQLHAVTGVRVGKRQIAEIITAAAADADRFCRGRDPGPEQDAAVPLALSADGKGVAMRPGALRRRGAKAPDERARQFEHHAGIGEKGHKRMAETGAVFDVIVPDGPARTPEQILHPGPDPRARPDGPRAENKWYTCDITADRAVTIASIFDQAEHRDPAHRRPWIVLADGDNHQLAVITAEAARRGIPVTIIIDFIHVLEYLWKAAWCFHQPRDPAIETWVTAQALDILNGDAAGVADRIEALAARHPPAGPEHARTIRKTIRYLRAKQQYMNYPAALANRWPIATGLIEGACRHLVQDRMAITGARWGLHGAQAILWLRAIHASGDTSTYWTWHISQEHHRNHLSRYHNPLDLAA